MGNTAAILSGKLLHCIGFSYSVLALHEHMLSLCHYPFNSSFKLFPHIFTSLPDLKLCNAPSQLLHIHLDLDQIKAHGSN
jgi:hypothetical protein